MKRGTFCSKLVALHFPPTSTPVKWWVLSHWSFFFLQKLYLWNSVWRSSSLCRTETWLGIFWQSVVFRVRGFWANITSLNRYSCSKKIFMQKQGTEEKSSQRDLSVLIRFWFLYRLNLWSGSSYQTGLDSHFKKHAQYKLKLKTCTTFVQRTSSLVYALRSND